MDSYWPLIVTVLVAALPGVIALLGSRRGNTADVASKYQEIASKQAEDNLKLEECQQRLEARVADLERALVNKNNKIDELERLTGTQEARIVEMMVESERSEEYIQALTGYVEVLVGLMQKAGIQAPQRPVRRRVM